MAFRTPVAYCSFNPGGTCAATVRLMRFPSRVTGSALLRTFALCLGGAGCLLGSYFSTLSKSSLLKIGPGRHPGLAYGQTGYRGDSSNASGRGNSVCYIGTGALFEHGRLFERRAAPIVSMCHDYEGTDCSGRLWPWPMPSPTRVQQWPGIIDHVQESIGSRNLDDHGPSVRNRVRETRPQTRVCPRRLSDVSRTVRLMTTAAAALDDLLAPIPTTCSLVGYGRVSTREQNLARQQDKLTAVGCIKCFFDKASGRNAERPGLADCFEYLRDGDVLVVLSLDRLGRSVEDLIRIVAELKRRGVGFHSIHERLDTTTPGGMFVFHVFAALAEFVRTIIVGNTNEGLAAARARGQRLGRPPAMTPEKLAYARELLARPEETMASIARLLEVSRSTLYNALPEIKGALPAPRSAATNPAPKRDRG